MARLVQQGQPGLTWAPDAATPRHQRSTTPLSRSRWTRSTSRPRGAQKRTVATATAILGHEAGREVCGADRGSPQRCVRRPLGRRSRRGQPDPNRQTGATTAPSFLCPPIPPFGGISWVRRTAGPGSPSGSRRRPVAGHCGWPRQPRGRRRLHPRLSLRRPGPRRCAPGLLVGAGRARHGVRRRCSGVGRTRPMSGCLALASGARPHGCRWASGQRGSLRPCRRPWAAVFAGGLVAATGPPAVVPSGRCSVPAGCGWRTTNYEVKVNGRFLETGCFEPHSGH